VLLRCCLSRTIARRWIGVEDLTVSLVNHHGEIMQLLNRGFWVSFFCAAASTGAPMAADAGVVTSWTSPSNGSSFLAGTIINPAGSANASGTLGGTGLDLALVLDSSGSMALINNGKSRQEWQQLAAIALVDALPAASTSVTIVEFDSNATLLSRLVPLSTAKAQVVSAINAVDASGGTTIGAGIDIARGELIGANATSGRTQMMVVVSDGSSSGSPAGNAASAIAAGVDAVHSVGIPGHNVPTMQAIAASGNGIYTNGNDLTGLINLFNGTAGNLVGIDRVDIQMNDGRFIGDIALDGLGNFVLPDATIGLGDNIFVATAFDTLGNSASASLVLVGLPIPEPSTWALFALGLAGVGVVANRRARGTN
jgi:hypothetical protein